jgi:hypothetical protein
MQVPMDAGARYFQTIRESAIPWQALRARWWRFRAGLRAGKIIAVDAHGHEGGTRRVACRAGLSVVVVRVSGRL